MCIRDRLKAGGYRLLDTQFTTSHLKQFGAIDVDRRVYQEMLNEAIAAPVEPTSWVAER